MATQVICILHAFPSPHPTSYLSHPNLKPIEPVTSWQDGGCGRGSSTQRIWLRFGAHRGGARSIERGGLQQAELSATVDGALDMSPLLQSCRFVAAAAAGFGPEL